MSEMHTKAVNDYIKRLKQEIAALKPSRETLKRAATEEEVPTICGNPIDVMTGAVVDYERLQPYMEKAGYLPALAFKLLQEDLQNDL